MTTAAGEVSTYRWARGHVLRLIGIGAVALGLVWLAAALLTAWLGAGRWVGGVGAAATAAALLGSCWLLVLPPRVLELSAAGYRTWHLRGGGVSSADWSQVQSVETRAPSGPRALVVELAGGRTSTVPVSLLGSRALEAQREMHTRLNTAFGYRRLSEGAAD